MPADRLVNTLLLGFASYEQFAAFLHKLTCIFNDDDDDGSVCKVS